MTLERNPNSKNMFYVEPELFPITNEVEEAGNDKVYLDEETGKFIFEFPTLYKVWIPVDLGEDMSNKRFILWVEKGIAQSAWSFTTIIEGTSVQTIDPNFSDFLIDTPSGERFYGYYVETESHGSSGEITFLVHPDTDFGSSPLGMALTHDDYVMSEWQSAYREAKIDLDPALSSKLITVGQLSRLKGSGAASGAQGSDLVTMGQLARLMGKAAPPDNQKGKLVTLSQLKRVQTLKIVSWADGTDEEIAAMVAAADAGQIVLSDYWSEGDTRTVSLSSMPATGVGESHAAQDVQFVLTDPGHYTLANGKKCSFVVLQKDCLSEYGYMNSSVTNSGGWNSCQRRTWCNNVYRNAIPASLRGIFKQFKVRTANGSGSGVTESTDWFSLFSEKEVFGSTTYANSSAESQNTQLNWFKTSSNRIKKNGMNGSARNWWERSPYSGNSSTFCFVTLSGSADWNGANYRYGLAPFGCI